MFGPMVVILSVGCMLIGVLCSLIFPKDDIRHARALSIFVLGAVVLVCNWLLKNPTELERIEYFLVTVFLGLLFTFIRHLKKRKNP